jgi:hypothetical protein
MVEEVSATGLSVQFPGTAALVGKRGVLHIDSVVVTVHRRWIMQCDGTVRAGFTIGQVNGGATQWHELTSLAA